MENRFDRKERQGEKRWIEKKEAIVENRDIKGDNKKTSTFLKRILLSFYLCYTNGLHLILITTKFVIQNVINQRCGVNTF